MKKFFAIIFLFFSSNSFAWSGYEVETNVSIDIGPGNLVKEGREINIYDFATETYHACEVLFVDYNFGGTRLEVKDLETNQKRIFIMDR